MKLGNGEEKEKKKEEKKIKFITNGEYLLFCWA
jgi:hypothetical protein